MFFKAFGKNLTLKSNITVSNCLDYYGSFSRLGRIKSDLRI